MKVSIVLPKSIERRIYMMMENHMTDLTNMAQQNSSRTSTIEGYVTRNTRDYLDDRITDNIYEIVKNTINEE